MIEVYIRCKKGKTLCICPRNDKRCNRNCEKDVVERDRFAGWYNSFRRDRYGK